MKQLKEALSQLEDQNELYRKLYHQEKVIAQLRSEVWEAWRTSSGLKK